MKQLTPRQTILANQPKHAMLDYLIVQMKLKNDAALSRILEVAPPVISKIRHKKLTFGPSLQIKAFELINEGKEKLVITFPKMREMLNA